jgi:hypothetical protein
MKILIFGVSTLLAILMAVVSVSAQAPAGPVAQSPVQAAPSVTSSSTTANPAADAPRKRDLTGSWKLNKDESTQPRKRDDDDSGGGRHGGGRSGGGWPGGGHGGYGGGGMHRGGMSDDARKEMQELMRPSETLAFKQDGPAIVMTDDYDRQRTFYTDGRKVKKSKDTDKQEYDAKWDDFRLVNEFKGPDGNKIDRTFEVLDGNQQLRETIHLTMGRSQREVYLRYVYDLKSGDTSAAK